MDYLARKSAHGACDGESYLALSLRSRNRRHAVLSGYTASGARGSRPRGQMGANERRTWDLEAQRLLLLEAGAQGSHVRGFRRAGHDGDLREALRDHGSNSSPDPLE